MVKIAILWESFPRYITKCIESLLNYSEAVRVLALCRSGGDTPQNATSRLQRFTNIETLDLSETKNLKNGKYEIIDSVLCFAPDIAILSLTRVGLFSIIARKLHKRSTIVVGACDNYWRGIWKDYANTLVSKLGLFSQYELVFVPGILGRQYVKKLGFKDKAIFEGLYTCDTSIFHPIGKKRHSIDSRQEWPSVFLYVGQYIHRKGIDTLLEAYSKYSEKVSNPWELWLVGKVIWKQYSKQIVPLGI
jgi:glycosyltransferase involved in cell wall biosynthesis